MPPSGAKIYTYVSILRDAIRLTCFRYLTVIGQLYGNFNVVTKSDSYVFVTAEE